jgi:hypothetical protein
LCVSCIPNIDPSLLVHRHAPSQNEPGSIAFVREVSLAIDQLLSAKLSVAATTTLGRRPELSGSLRQKGFREVEMDRGRTDQPLPAGSDLRQRHHGAQRVRCSAPTGHG